MIKWIKSLFGEGKLVYDITTNKNSYRVRIAYVGLLSSIDHKEVINQVNLNFGYGEFITKWEFKGVTSL